MSTMMKKSDPDFNEKMEPQQRLLLVEDDIRLASTIQEYLQQSEFEVDIETRGNLAIELILRGNHDLVVLDLTLPGMDGLEICRQIRQEYRKPILMLTARDDSIEQVVGLEIGADDYVTKPVEPRLLLARIRALLRHAKRTGESDENTTSRLTFGQLTIDQHDRTITYQGNNINCSEIDFGLMWLLASNAGQVLSRDYIFETLNGYTYDGLDRSVDIRISRLRKRLQDNSGNPARIKTVRGKGYLFVEAAWNQI